MSIQPGSKNNILITKKSVIVYLDHFLHELVRNVRRRMGRVVEAIESRTSAVDPRPSPAKNLYPSPQGEFCEVKYKVQEWQLPQNCSTLAHDQKY